MGIDLEERTTGGVAEWRRVQLVQAGFSLPVASRLAQDVRYDLHALLELVDHGCPPALAARIVAPVDEERAA